MIYDYTLCLSKIFCRLIQTSIRETFPMHFWSLLSHPHLHPTFHHSNKTKLSLQQYPINYQFDTVTHSSQTHIPHHHHTTVLRPFFRNHPGELVPEDNFWTLWCKGWLTEADTPTIRMGTTPSGLSSAHHHPPFFTGQIPFLPPNQQCQSTEGKQTHIHHSELLRQCISNCKSYRYLGSNLYNSNIYTVYIRKDKIASKASDDKIARQTTNWLHLLTAKLCINCIIVLSVLHCIQ